MAPRWRKAASDIAVRPGRAALAVLAMTVGVGALGTLAFKHTILAPVLATMYGGTQPASAILYTDRIDDALVDAARAVPGVGDAEARPMIMARVRVGTRDAEEWIPCALYVIRDFDAQRMSLFEPDSGTWPPADGEVLLERSAVSVAGAARGDALQLRTPGGGEASLGFVGTVHAPGLAPAWMEHMVYGFVPWTSSVRADGVRESSQLLVRVADHADQVGHIHEVAERVEAELTSRGVVVRRVDVPPPGQHPHATQMATFLYLLATFAILAFLLSAVLVASMIHTLQSEQVRQIGMMKAVGATRRQITGVYLAHVGLLAAAALCLGVPLGWFAGRAYARFAAGILNADVAHSPFPWPTLLALSVVGLVVPVLAAWIPLWRGARVSVREALSHAPGAPRTEGWLERALLKLTWLSRPLVYVLRGTFVRRGRLALTIGVLAIAGGMFMAALNVSKAWDDAATDTFARHRYDLRLWLAEPQPVAELDRLFASLPSIARAAYWPQVNPFLVGADGAAGERITLLGVDPSSTLLEPKLVDGHWLDAATPDGVVFNHVVAAMHPRLALGDTVALRLDGRTLRFPVVGRVQELLPQRLIYVPKQTLLEATGRTLDSTRTVRLVAREHDDAAQRAAARDVEQLLASHDIEVSGLHRTEDIKGAILDHLVIIQQILTLAAGLVVVVGAIGLTSTLAIHVVQRRREIGIMSALGATPRTLAGHVWCEGVLIALLSWTIALVLALPAGYALGHVTGQMFFKQTLAFTLSPAAVAVWLGLVVVLGSLASVQPALHAARLTVREAIRDV